MVHELFELPIVLSHGLHGGMSVLWKHTLA